MWVQKNVRRASSAGEAGSSTWIFLSNCILSNSVTKRTSGSKETRKSCETQEAKSMILESAEIDCDKALLLKLQNVDFVAKEVKYHNSCRSSYNC